MCFKHVLNTQHLCAKIIKYMKNNSHDSIIKLLDAKFVITYQKEFASISPNDVLKNYKVQLIENKNIFNLLEYK